MASCSNELTGRQAQGKRTLWVKPNAQFVYKALDSYDKNKTNQVYLSNEKLKLAIPFAIERTGTVATNIFTSALETDEVEVGGYLAIYKKADFDAADKTLFKGVEWRKVTATTGTAHTVDGSDIGTDKDTFVYFSTYWQQVYGVTDITFETSAEQIDTSTNLTGKIKTSISGQITAEPSITGLYMPNIPTQSQLERLQMKTGCTVECIVTRGLSDGETFFQGAFEVNTFTDGGAVSGSDVQSLDASMIPTDGGTWKEFVDDYNFETAVTISEY